MWINKLACTNCDSLSVIQRQKIVKQNLLNQSENWELLYLSSQDFNSCISIAYHVIVFFFKIRNFFGRIVRNCM